MKSNIPTTVIEKYLHDTPTLVETVLIFSMLITNSQTQDLLHTLHMLYCWTTGYYLIHVNLSRDNRFHIWTLLYPLPVPRHRTSVTDRVGYTPWHCSSVSCLLGQVIKGLPPSAKQKSIYRWSCQLHTLQNIINKILGWAITIVIAHPANCHSLFFLDRKWLSFFSWRQKLP